VLHLADLNESGPFSRQLLNPVLAIHAELLGTLAAHHIAFLVVSSHGTVFVAAQRQGTL
jgi:hypothetical protein